MLQVENLTLKFLDKRGGNAVYNIDFSMSSGEMLGVVGESGAGKSLTALAIAGLLPRKRVHVSGDIHFEGIDLIHCERSVLRSIQGKEIGFVFQESMTALNPLMRIGEQIGEALLIHEQKLSKEDRKKRIIETMHSVELPNPEDIYIRYPHQLSGGQRQRVMIAAAIICKPKLLIADEPTTALDVTVQAQIVELFKQINRVDNTAVLFISHDLRVVRQICTRIIVMRKGLIEEIGETESIFKNPKAEYTKYLINTIPRKGKRLV